MVSKEIKLTVDGLSQEDRASLARYILHGFNAPSYDVSDEEVAQRLSELQLGDIEEMDHKSLIKGLDLQDRK